MRTRPAQCLYGVVLTRPARAGQRYGEAMDHALEIVRLDRAWDDGAGRRLLFRFFDTLGAGHEEVGGRGRGRHRRDHSSEWLQRSCGKTAERGEEGAAHSWRKGPGPGQRGLRRAGGLAEAAAH